MMMRMRPSLSLALIALWANFAYGFSSDAVVAAGGGAVVGGDAGTSSSFFRRRSATSRSPLPSFVATGRSQSAVSRCSLLLQQQQRISVVPRGGGGSTSTTKKNITSSPIDTGSKCPVTGLAALFGSVWGAGGVLYILAKAIKRVVPIALEPFQAGAIPLSQFELGAYIVTCLWFAYVEGYKGFQLKFSPLVVKRSFTLIPGKNGTKWYHYFLAPMYSMGLIHATKKRKIVSWSVSIGVAGIVAAVKRLPYPWRNIIDAGVVVGLSWGSLSILVLYLKAWITGQPPQTVDASLPELTTAAAKKTK